MQSLPTLSFKPNKRKIQLHDTFTKIATKTQQAWEQLKAAQGAHEEHIILKTVKHIQASITGLEQRYENIQAKVTENFTEMVSNKFNEIQAKVTENITEKGSNKRNE